MFVKPPNIEELRLTRRRVKFLCDKGDPNQVRTFTVRKLLTIRVWSEIQHLLVGEVTPHLNVKLFFFNPTKFSALVIGYIHPSLWKLAGKLDMVCKKKRMGRSSYPLTAINHTVNGFNLIAFWMELLSRCLTVFLILVNFCHRHATFF